MTGRGSMEITEVKIFPVGEEKLKAFVSIVIDHCFMVNDIKVIRGRDGLFISMPSRRKKNGEFKDVAHPLNNDTRRSIETQILEQYERVLVARGEEPSTATAAATSRPRALESGTAKSGEAKSSTVAEVGTGARPAEGRTLKEVEEIHLRDSFWSVP